MFNLQILGRSVNVAKILAHSINNSIRKSIDVAIQRFENTSIHGIVVLDDMLNVAKLTHKLISRKLDLIPFDDMFNQVDDRLLQSSNGGRIVNHVIQEIADDLIPNSAYNSITNRFVEAGVIFVEKSGRNSPTKCQQMYLYGSKSFSIASATKNAEYSGFFGSVHFEIIKRVVGHGNFLMIASEITNHVDVMVKNTLSTYIDVIQKGSPTSLKLPIFEYGVTGAYEYFCAHLKPIIQYSDLSSEVFQTFREVGNAILVVKFIQEQISVSYQMEMIQATPLLEDYRITGTITEIKQSGHVISKNSQVLIEDIEKYKTASDLRFSVFHDLVDKLKETMLELNKDWKSDESLIDNPKSFFRIWSALQFVFSCPQSQGQVTNREIFGESLAWAGCMMIHCLGQRDLFFAFDYASHILECEKNDKKSSKSEVRGDVALFLKSSLILRQENDFIFSFLGIN